MTTNKGEYPTSGRSKDRNTAETTEPGYPAEHGGADGTADPAETPNPCNVAQSSQAGPQGERYLWRGYVRTKGAAVRYGEVMEHRAVATELLGRPLGEHEVIHHRNEVKHDNRPENLVLMSKRGHLSWHHKKPMKPWIRRLLTADEMRTAPLERYAEDLYDDAEVCWGPLYLLLPALRAALDAGPRGPAWWT